jgi:hypothetical protein
MATEKPVRMTICNSREVKGRTGISIVIRPFYLFMFMNTRCQRILAQDLVYILHTMLKSSVSNPCVVTGTFEPLPQCSLQDHKSAYRSAETIHSRLLLKQLLDCMKILSTSQSSLRLWRCQNIFEPMVGMIHNCQPRNAVCGCGAGVGSGVDNDWCWFRCFDFFNNWCWFGLRCFSFRFGFSRLQVLKRSE